MTHHTSRARVTNEPQTDGEQAASWYASLRDGEVSPSGVEGGFGTKAAYEAARAELDASRRPTVAMRRRVAALGDMLIREAEAAGRIIRVDETGEPVPSVGDRVVVRYPEGDADRGTVAEVGGWTVDVLLGDTGDRGRRLVAFPFESVTVLRDDPEDDSPSLTQAGSTNDAPVPAADPQPEPDATEEAPTMVTLTPATTTDPAHAGWFTVYEEGDQWLVVDGSGTTRPLTFGGSRGQELAEEYAVDMANAMEVDEAAVHATRAGFLPLAIASTGHDPMNPSQPLASPAYLDPSMAHRVGFHDIESDLECDLCRDLIPSLSEADAATIVEFRVTLPSGVETPFAIEAESLARRDALVAFLLAHGIQTELIDSAD